MPWHARRGTTRSAAVCEVSGTHSLARDRSFVDHVPAAARAARMGSPPWRRRRDTAEHRRDTAETPQRDRRAIAGRDEVVALPSPLLPGDRKDHLPLNLPRPYMGAPDRRAPLLLCTRSVSPVDGSIGQMQSRSTAPSRLAWQNRVATASWESRVCPHESHTLIGASPSTCSGPGDWISNSVVIMVT
jgi:hypothetical protein